MSDTMKEYIAEAEKDLQYILSWCHSFYFSYL